MINSYWHFWGYPAIKFKITIKIIIILLVLTVLAACTQAPDRSVVTAEGAANIGMILGPGGTGDRGFNDAALSGLLRAELEYGITFELSIPAVGDDIYAILRPKAESGELDLIIVMGAGVSAEALVEIAPLFPDQRFSHVDSELNLTNVSAIQTNWVEQTFLAGVMAGLGTLSDMPLANDYNKIGIIVGMDTFPMRQGILGFEAGARLVNPDVTVLVEVIGSFSDVYLAYEIALDMYNQGADFIQSIGGAAGLGIHEAARATGRYSLASGANTNFIEPDHIVGTALRDVAGIVFNEICSFLSGTWQAGLHISGIAEGAVGYDTFQSNVVAPDNIIQAIQQLYNQIASGELVLPSSADELGEWLERNAW